MTQTGTSWLRGKTSRALTLVFLAGMLCAFTPPALAQPLRLGDLDADNLATVSDLVRLINHVNGTNLLTAPLLPYGDIDEDGVIDQRDVDLVANAILGLAPLPNPYAAPVLNPIVAATNGSMLVITGVARPNRQILVTGGRFAVFGAADSNGLFSVSVELRPNQLNHLFVTASSTNFPAGTPQPLRVLQDSQPPSLYIDFPADGQTLYTSDTVIAGRVGDMLSGFMGLSVGTRSTASVESLPANVNVGIGNNGTYERSLVPLALGTNEITVTASDAFGNSTIREIRVIRGELSGPRLLAVSGDLQMTNVHRRLAQPLIVKATQADGVTPFANQLVTLEVTRSDGRLLPVDLNAVANPSALTNDITHTVHGNMSLQLFTDANGEARAWWALGGDAGCGNNRVCAMSAGISNAVYYCASARPAAVYQINIGTGNNQKAETGGFVAEPLRAWASDSCNGIEGLPITFTIIQGGGKLVGTTSTSSQTNNGNGVEPVPTTSLVVTSSMTGHAEALLQLGPDAGQNIIEANYPGNPGLPATFIAYGVARDPSQPTRLSGLVLDNTSCPLGGAVCSLSVGGQMFFTATDAQGQFHFTNTPAGPAFLTVNGSTATNLLGATIPTNSFPSLEFALILIPNAENSLPSPVLLPRLNLNNQRLYYGTNDLVLTCEGMEGLKMTIKAGSMRKLDGTLVTPANPATVSLNQVHHDNVPMPIPDGASPPFAWTLQPGGATFDPPITIEYPNMSSLPAGTVAYFLSFNHDTRRFEIIASGHVTADSATILTDPGVGLTIAGWGCNCPPYSITGVCQYCPKSKDISAGFGDVVTIDLSAPGLSEFQLVADADPQIGQVLKLNNWATELREKGILHFLPVLQANVNYDYASPVTFQLLIGATCGDAGNQQSQDLTVNVTLGSGYTAFHLSGSVGEGVNNPNPLDVYRVQQRLKYLGFRGEGQTVVPVDGVSGTVTIQAIKLFEAATTTSGAGDPGNSSGTVSVGFPGGNLDWLNAVNAPRWRQIDLSLTDPQYIHMETWATSWALDIIDVAVLVEQAIAGRITSLTEYPDVGPTIHAEHKAGLDIDIGFGDILPPLDSQAPVFMTGTPREDMLAALSPNERLIFNFAYEMRYAAGNQFQKIYVGGDAPGGQREYPRLGQVFTEYGIVPNSSLSVHWNHLHVSLVPPPIGVPASGPSLPQSFRPQGPASPLQFPASLDSTWTIAVAGQNIAPSAGGGFRIPNISAPDQFGPGGPGSPPDFLSDDFLRLTGTSTKNGVTRYAFSDRFQIQQGQTYSIGDLIFTGLPPRKPESLSIVLSNRTAFIGQNLPLTVLARFADGSTTNVAARTTWTTYRVSNPSIATVSPDGVVMPLRPGGIYVTAANEGVATTCGLNIVTGTDGLTTVTGTVVDTNGVAVVGATVRIYDLIVDPVTTDADGRFTIPNVPSSLGPLRLRVRFVIDGRAYTAFIRLEGVSGGQTQAGLLVLRPFAPTNARFATGGTHSVALREDGTLWAWGRNTYGQLGNGTNISATTPQPIQTNVTWQAVAAGLEHTLALRVDGTLWAWGRNTYGQLGNGTNISANKPQPIQTNVTWQAVAAGLEHTLALRVDGTLWAWGRNTYGQLGNGTNISANKPQPIQTNVTWQAVAAGWRHTVALRADGTLWVWGDNTYGQLGNGTNISATTPQPIQTNVTWQAVAAGLEHTLALRVDGTLWAWGRNTYGQLGNGTNISANKPQPIQTNVTWQAVAAGDSHTVALREDGTLWAWGENTFGHGGQLGNGTFTSANTPQLIQTNVWWQAVAAGGNCSVALRENGTLWAWGENTYGQLGNGKVMTNQELGSSGSNIPQLIQTNVTWQTVAAGDEYTLALSSAGTLWAWGNNYDGQLGNGTFASTDTPQPILSNVTWQAVSAGVSHTEALRADGTLWGWGRNTFGQLGDGTSARANTPQWNQANGVWKAVAPGNYHTVALSSASTLWGWGENNEGQVGNVSSGAAPKPIAAGVTWQAVAAGDYHTLALRADATLWAWGRNTYGQLGNGTFSSTNNPQPIQTNMTWQAVAAGWGYTVALSTSGTLWAWGENSFGQLGNGTFASVNAPQPIQTNVTWQAVAAGSAHTVALRADGTLWTWGDNSNGQLGNGTFVDNNTPQPIQTNVMWRAVAAGEAHTVALRADGTLWAWGANKYGQIAQPESWLPHPVLGGAVWGPLPADSKEPVITSHPSNQTVAVGAATVFRVEAIGTAPLGYQWQFNGADLPDANTPTLTLSNVQFNQAGLYRAGVFNGVGHALSSNAVLTVLAPPAINQQPQSQTVNSASNVTFTVAATGTTPFTYQWRLNGINIPNATNGTLTLASVQSGVHDGGYSVVVSNDYGSVVSATAVLTILARPVITQQLAPGGTNNVAAGSTFSFTISASGKLPMSYRFRRGGATFTNVILNANTCVLTIPNVQSNLHAGTWTVAITNSHGPSMPGFSAASVLNIYPGTVFTVQPTNQTVLAGANVSFIAAVTGYAPLQYQWYRDSTPLANQTNTTLNLLDLTTNDAGTYLLSVSNVLGIATSSNAILTVTNPP